MTEVPPHVVPTLGVGKVLSAVTHVLFVAVAAHPAQFRSWNNPPWEELAIGEVALSLVLAASLAGASGAPMTNCMSGAGVDFHASIAFVHAAMPVGSLGSGGKPFARSSAGVAVKGLKPGAGVMLLTELLPGRLYVNISDPLDDV